MITIKDLLKERGTHVYSIAPHATVFEALQEMAEKDVGALVVIENDRVVGIFSERDYARKVALKGRSSRDWPVGDLMTSKIFFITPEKTIEDCMTLMTMKKIRHVPVMDNDKLAGLVSIGDIVSKIISAQKHTIKELENYIIGGYGATIYR